MPPAPSGATISWGPKGWLCSRVESVSVSCHLATLCRLGIAPRYFKGALRHESGAGDVVLNGEDVRQVAVVGFRPQGEAIRDIDELGGNPQLIARLEHAALQHGADVEQFANLAHVLLLVFEDIG